MTIALAPRHTDLLPNAERWSTMLQMAGELVKSGLLPNAIKTPAAALAIIQTGMELGLPPMYALRKISVINGRPVVEAEVMLAMIYRDHGDNAVLFDETSAERCVVRYKRRGWEKYQRFSWTIDEAQKAGLLGKDVWKQYPPAMLRARCISAMARAGFPDTIGGLYVHEEVGGEVEVRDGEIVPLDRPQAVVSMVERTVPAPLAADHYNRLWHGTVKGTRFADDETRHAFVASFSEGRFNSLTAYLATATDEQADALISAIEARVTLEAEYSRLAALAVARGHRDAAKIKTKLAQDLSDDLLAGSVAALGAWEAKLPAAAAVDDDGDEPF
jgi:hypothetical protein